MLERRRPDQDRISSRLAHPPFSFATGGFTPGTLEAIGYIGGRESARHSLRTPGAPNRLLLSIDQSGRPRDRSRKDQVFCHASIVDANGTVIAPAWEHVAFGLAGGGALVGDNPATTDAGIATILVECLPGAAPSSVYALALLPEGGPVRVLSGSVGIDHAPEPHSVSLTGERAELSAAGRVVASLSSGAPRFRIPVSTPPGRRGVFHR